MKIKNFLIAFLACFVVFCGLLIVESAISKRAVTSSAPVIDLAAETSMTATETIEPQGYDFSGITAVNAKSTTKILGELYPEVERFEDENRFKFQVELTSKGAAVSRVVMSEFDDRDPDDPANFVLLSPVDIGKDYDLHSLANGYFELVDQKRRFPLHKLNWRLLEEYDRQKTTFAATLKDVNGKDIVDLKKTYYISPGSYDLLCDLDVENLSDSTLKVKIELQGPAGTAREAARFDMRSVIAGFIASEGKVDSVKIDGKKLRKENGKVPIAYDKAGADFIWSALTNKYFAAIVRPIPPEGTQRLKEATPDLARYYDPGFNVNPKRKPDGDENISFTLSLDPIDLAPAGDTNAGKTFGFQVYLGPKDKAIFNKNDVYRKSGYFHTISFMTCCCPQAVIGPLAFAIMGIMKALYAIIPNYGVVIMILVFLVRLCMHPVTKKSQVSMMRMQKLGPKMEEIKKKYANNKAEMNKQVMGLYKEQGVNPFASMLPMMLQMPIWISLWTAVYASIDLRGAPFLPVWITDLSAPDALIRFTAIDLPLMGKIDSFNLLPILMGVVMFLQQKLMANKSAQASANPQMAQQQKMMMIMMPLLFPFMLYKGPSGVNLYIMSSISAGVIEQVIIRRHIKQKEAAEATGLVSVTSKTGGKVKKKKPKPFYKNTM